jgi:hypothetical protein
LSQRDRGKQSVLSRRCRDQVDIDSAGVFAHRDCAGLAARRGGNQQVLYCAAKADPEVMIIGIDDRRSTCKVRQHAEAARARHEPPRLRVVAIGGERCVAHEVGERC